MRCYLELGVRATEHFTRMQPSRDLFSPLVRFFSLLRLLYQYTCTLSLSPLALCASIILVFVQLLTQMNKCCERLKRHTEVRIIQCTFIKATVFNNVFILVYRICIDTFGILVQCCITFFITAKLYVVRVGCIDITARRRWARRRLPAGVRSARRGGRWRQLRRLQRAPLRLVSRPACPRAPRLWALSL